MLSYDNLSKAQRRWVDLVEILFPELYKCGIINHSELKMVHETLLEMREQDKKYKVSWPIWLISNNAVTRGSYQIPKSGSSEVIQEKDPDENHPFYQEYLEELKQFKVVA